MTLYAIDPVSGKRLPVVIDGKDLVASCGPVALSALILIDDADTATLRRLYEMGYRNVQVVRVRQAK